MFPLRCGLIYRPARFHPSIYLLEVNTPVVQQAGTVRRRVHGMAQIQNTYVMNLEV